MIRRKYLNNNREKERVIIETKRERVDRTQQNQQQKESIEIEIF